MNFHCLIIKYTYLIETKKKKEKIQHYLLGFDSSIYLLIFVEFPSTTTFAGTLFVRYYDSVVAKCDIWINSAQTIVHWSVSFAVKRVSTYINMYFRV
ncbi:hypothetical protein C5695_09160 [Bacillus pumilus]|uniref:Uncharacterized protein n=1 Tax=Bacillus pumilus TaxID=1408 RepID=A0AAD0MLI0_BACPU|nr:hypothetical protein C5695_09160 [Bacillus pumilus]